MPTLTVGQAFKRYRVRAKFTSCAAVASRVGCSGEYIRQIEGKGKIPGDKIVDKFIEACRVPATAADELRKAVVAARLKRTHGKDLTGFKGADQVASGVCDDLRELLDKMGLIEEDQEAILEATRMGIVSRLR